MKIAIIGAHGTGKTTLSEELSKKLQYPLINEVIRTLPQDISSESLQYLTFVLQVQYEDNYKDFVSDRGIIDNYVYFMLKHPNSNRFKDIEALYLSIVRNRYDIIFYLPIEFKLVDDGYRNMDIQFQHDVDSMIRFILKRDNIVAHTVRGNTIFRVRTCINLINAYRLKRQ